MFPAAQLRRVVTRGAPLLRQYVRNMTVSTTLRNKEAQESIATLPTDHMMLRDTLRQYATDVLQPQAGHWDKNHEYPASAVKEMSDLGLMGIICDEENNGSGLDYLAYAIAIEEISRGCATCGVILSAQNSLYLAPIHYNGTPDQKHQWIDDYANGSKIGCFALSEPGNGSDAGAASCSARKDGTRILFNKYRSEPHVNTSLSPFIKAHEITANLLF